MKPSRPPWVPNGARRGQDDVWRSVSVAVGGDRVPRVRNVFRRDDAVRALYIRFMLDGRPVENRGEDGHDAPDGVHVAERHPLRRHARDAGAEAAGIDGAGGVFPFPSRAGGGICTGIRADARGSRKTWNTKDSVRALAATDGWRGGFLRFARRTLRRPDDPVLVTHGKRQKI